MLRLRKHGLSKDLPPEWHDLSKRAGASIAESSSYLVGKLVAYERLLDDLFVADLAKRRRIDVSCHKYDGQSRALGMRLARHFRPIHSGHGKVDESKIDVRSSIQQLERRATATDFEDDVAALAQHGSRNFTHRAVVIDHQNYGAARLQRPGCRR